jgi:hypothetical protein
MESSAFCCVCREFGETVSLAGIATIEAANALIREVHIPAHDARFAVKAEHGGSAFVAIPGVDLGEILCVQEERQVGNDNCVTFNRLKLQIPESPLRPHFVKAEVKVRQYQDGTHAVFYGQRRLGRYDDKGAFRQEKWSLGQQVLDVAQRQRAPHVHHYRQANYLWRTVEISERVAHDRNLPPNQRRPQIFGLTMPFAASSSSHACRKTLRAEAYIDFGNRSRMLRAS